MTKWGWGFLIGLGLLLAAPTPVQAAGNYATVTQATTVYQDASLAKTSTAKLTGRTYRIVATTSVDGASYVTLANAAGQVQGVVAASAITTSTAVTGAKLAGSGYVGTTGTTAWTNAGLTAKTTLAAGTYTVTGQYVAVNGQRYTQLSNGRVVAASAVHATPAQGDYQRYGKYVTLTRGGYATYASFNWTKKAAAGHWLHHTFVARGRYRHANGSTYLSLYDGKGRWQGYINAKAAKVATGPQGVFQAASGYVGLTKRGYTTWQNFNWRKRSSSSSHYQQVYRVRGRYYHLNGGVYDSLVDAKGKWQGYINANATRSGAGKQGPAYSSGMRVRIKSKHYQIYRNFSWRRLTTSKKRYGKVYYAKKRYRHFNGSWYDSLYDSKGKWAGYINHHATENVTGVASYLGISRSTFVNGLAKHEHDHFYLGTKYRGLASNNAAKYMVPRGVHSKYGSGMNCTGFVAYALRHVGANLGQITKVANAWGGVANAYNFKNALVKRVPYYRYSSIKALLAAGKAKKGDLIFFEHPKYDCHIGVFWGNSAHSDRFWQSDGPGNRITKIHATAPYKYVYLFPMN